MEWLGYGTDARLHLNRLGDQAERRKGECGTGALAGQFVRRDAGFTISKASI